MNLKPFLNVNFLYRRVLSVLFVINVFVAFTIVEVVLAAITFVLY